MSKAFRRRTRGNRGQIPRRYPRPVTFATATFVAVATKLRLTCNTNVALKGVPHIGLSGGAHAGTAYPTSVAVISGNIFDLDYLANVAAADVIHGDERDPAIRTATGGYLTTPSGAVT